MSLISNIEQSYSSVSPTKTILHLYAIGGNSISTGVTSYIQDFSAVSGMLPAMKAKYWDVEHVNVWRLENKYGVANIASSYDMRYVKKEYEPLYIAPETGNDSYSCGMIIGPKLYELYGGNKHIAFCHVFNNGTGFRNTSTSWNLSVADPITGSTNLTKQLGRALDITIKHLTAMGYDVRLKGILMIGQTNMDVENINDSIYDKATLKTDISDVINYFRITLGHTDVPFYFNESTETYEPSFTQVNAALNELHISLGHIYTCKTNHWAVTSDGMHINGRTAVDCWGEGAAVGSDKNMAELIYSVENP
jgi:hypothetical protein